MAHAAARCAAPCRAGAGSAQAKRCPPRVASRVAASPRPSSPRLRITAPPPARAAEGDAPGEQDPEEARLERVERQFKSYNPTPGAPPRQPVRSANFPVPKPAKAPKQAPWSERLQGKPMPEQAWLLWTGEEGVLWWASKIAYASVFVVIGGWVVFRFVGPATGLYTLKSGISDIPL